MKGQFFKVKNTRVKVYFQILNTYFFKGLARTWGHKFYLKQIHNDCKFDRKVGFRGLKWSFTLEFTFVIT